ncbi:MAG: BRCT domain-containing protein, partial [bacterium]
IEYCPKCGSEIEIIENGDALTCICPNIDCPQKRIGQIVKLCSPEFLDIKNIGPSTIEKLVDKGLVKDFVDLYDLDIFDWCNVDGLGKKSYVVFKENLETNIHKLNKAMVLAYLRLNLHGYTKIIKFLDKFWDMDIDVLQKKDIKERIIEQKGYTEYSFDIFWEELQKKRNLFDKMMNRFNRIIKINNAKKINKRTNKTEFTYCVTGPAPDMSRNEFKNYLSYFGGKMVSSKKAEILICSDKNSNTNKSKEARQRKIPIYTYEEIFKKYSKNYKGGNELSTNKQLYGSF